MKKCLLILGMHRSGTSAFTGTLNNLGVNLGKNLMPSKPDNPKGFFENRIVHDINNDIFTLLNSHWSDIFPLSEKWWESPIIRPFHRRISSFINNEFNDNAIFALKDPRLCRLAPIWIQVLKENNIEPFFVLIARNPAEVAASLKERNDMAPEVAMHLWFRHVLEAEFQTRDHHRGFVSFEKLIEQPNTSVLGTIKQLRLESDIDTTPLVQAETNFIDKSMRHHVITNSDDSTFKLAATCYEILQSLSENILAPITIHEKFDEIRNEYQNLFDIFLSEEMCDLAKMRSIITTCGEEISHLKQRHKEELKLVQDKADQELEVLHEQYEGKMKGALFTLKCQNEFAATESQKLINKLKTENELLKAHLSHSQTTVEQMQETLGWQLADKTRAVAHKLLPPDSLRRRAGRVSVRSAKVLIQEGPKSLLQKSGNKIIGSKLSFQDTLLESLNINPDSENSLHFKENDNVQASIIIPVYNNWSYTWKCLLSIYHRTEGNYEIIIVDNGSTDETPKRLAKCTGITVITNSTNEVFVTGCNQGAEAANGEYLIFLNNDTEVTIGWLQALLAPFSDPKTGIVGGRLLYPDGSLQEAGNIVWSDGNGWNYGHGDDPYLPQYSYRKEVDYCSGACLAIPQNLWQKLGGFDIRYRPAYYEDTDLCFSARKYGYKVIYQPEAQVIHHGGASAGTNTSQGYKKYQEINKAKFQHKWKHTLTRDHYSDPSMLYLARERGAEKRILIIDHYAPTFDKDSGSLRMFSLIQIFQELGFKVLFWPDNREYDKRYTLELQRLGVEVFFGDTTFEQFIIEYGKYLDVVLLSRPYIAKNYIHLVKTNSNAITIFDTVDLHYLREERKAKLIVEQWKNLEFYLANETDATLVVSPTEKEILSQEEFIDKVHIVSNVHQLQDCNNNFIDRTGLMFIGGFNHPPNEDGILWFVNAVLPLIKRKLPGIHLTIVGSNPSQELQNLQNQTIDVTGYVEDVSTYFEDARVFVCPLRYGAGVKGKLGQSISYGLPVVTTSVGAEGMGLSHGVNALIADQAEDFAQNVIELYTDANTWQKISNNSRKVIEENFSIPVIKNSLINIFDQNKSDNKPRYILLHCHLFKNAGTTFDWSLHRFFGAKFYEHHDDEQMKRGRKYLGPFLKENKGISALTSHHVTFPLPTEESLHLIPAIIFRHPIDRIGSVYSFERQQFSNTPGAKKAKELSFKDYVGWRLLKNTGATIRNYQTRYFIEEDSADLTQYHFEVALDEIEKIPLIGVVERYDETMVVFEHYLDHFFPHIDLSYIRQNVSNSRDNVITKRIATIKTSLGPQLFEKVIESNGYDLKIHDIANRKLDCQISQITNFEKKLSDFKDRCRMLQLSANSSVDKN
ncbi:glycosyltransferase [Desulfosediminicola ganghwensis]|uniref:glycosyltransferase n=1 Tax=Desulfosediminicola ganghwensis TaxID=2569540 RepID=UPI0010AD2023|nr:glycosyltransferase [Desulfosediminicola ganghwensis]